jgi:aspartyl-tRNA(Asn)/glutamyl-tRNA(Gln) amidotransferase subunit C
MLINRKELEQIALLAKLQIEDGEMQALVESLDSIVNMIDHINEADTDGIKPMANPLDAVQRLRKDAVEVSTLKETLLGLAKNTDEDFYLVPKVVE